MLFFLVLRDAVIVKWFLSGQFFPKRICVAVLLVADERNRVQYKLALTFPWVMDGLLFGGRNAL